MLSEKPVILLLCLTYLGDALLNMFHSSNEQSPYGHQL